MLVITKNADVRKLELGQQYFIDTFPDAKEENQEVTQEMFEARDKLQLAVDRHLEQIAKKRKVVKAS